MRDEGWHKKHGRECQENAKIGAREKPYKV
jgi:hypothetical protein